MTNRFQFNIKATDGRARTGVISTPKGDIRTPAFMPVGTLGTVKGMVSFWADDFHRGEKLKGHQLNRWAKDVLRRVQDLDAEFNEDEKIRKEVKK